MPYDERGQWYTDTYGHRRSDTERNSDAVEAQIPIIGGMSGASDRLQRDWDTEQADANRAYWDTLQTPTAQDLTPDYRPEGRDAQMAALAQMQEWGRGGLTGADRAMMESTRRRDEQAAGSSRRAMMQQAQARGVGGSGLDYGSQMMATQAGQQQASDAESQMLQGAQQRALQAVQQQGTMGGALRSGDQHEAEASVDATQQAFEDAASRAAGATQQYGTDVGSGQRLAERRAQRDRDTTSALGSILAAIAS